MLEQQVGTNTKAIDDQVKNSWAPDQENRINEFPTISESTSTHYPVRGRPNLRIPHIQRSVPGRTNDFLQGRNDATLSKIVAASSSQSRSESKNSRNNTPKRRRSVSSQEDTPSRKKHQHLITLVNDFPAVQK